MEFNMPIEAEVGSSVDLKCGWKILGVSKLYSVKWYKDDHEFFRYMPDNDPKTQMFPRAGVKVEVRILNRFRRNLISSINVLINIKSIRHNLDLYKYRILFRVSIPIIFT